ncbi:MAG TPA: holin [Candidatus Anaerobutyricum stercoris]|uniref:Holin n=1 Tax=Candidatus Anaerobutyricum stercoris TaxID=2838457 RepID=A0A9D2J8K7_9FIRM|nr:holin [Candidatus Anaerobutyricum stercoris]
MFKNCVLKPDVNTIKWIKAAGIRAIKTMAQAAIGSIGAAATLGAVDWRIVCSTAVLAGVVSILTSVVGIPEVEE